MKGEINHEMLSYSHTAKHIAFVGVLLFPPVHRRGYHSGRCMGFDNSIDTMTSYQDGIMLKEGNQLWFWNPDQPEPQKVGDAIFFGIQALFTDDDGQLLALGEAAETLSFFVAC